MPVPAGLGLHLGSVRRKRPEELAEGPHISGDVLIDPSSTIGKGGCGGVGWGGLGGVGWVFTCPPSIG